MLYLKGAYLVGFQTQKALFLRTQKNFYRNLILNLIFVSCQCHYKVLSTWEQESRHVLTYKQGPSTTNPRVSSFTVTSPSADMSSRHVQKVLPRTGPCIYLYFKYDII